MNSFYRLPNDLLLMIYHFIDIKSKNEMKNLNKYFKHICAFNAKTLHIHKPNDKFITKCPHDILVKIMQSHINMKKLIIGSEMMSEHGKFTLNEKQYIDPLIEHLSKNENELSHINEIIIEEIRDCPQPSQSPELFQIYKELNSAWFKVFSHAHLQSLTVIACHCSGQNIQRILDKAIQLKKFTLIGHVSIQSFTISLKGLTELTTVKFHNFDVPKSNLTSLNTCYKLHTLVIDAYQFSADNIVNVLIDVNHGIWPLKRLEIPNVSINLNTELHVLAKKYPQLEKLSIFIKMDVDDAVINKTFEFVTLWPNLQAFHFNGSGITSNAIHIVTKHMSKLKTLLFNYKKCVRLRDYPITITSDGITSITNNCPNLQILKLSVINNLKISDLVALQKCKALKILELIFMTSTGNMFYNLRYLANHLPKLTHCDFSSPVDNIQGYKNKLMIEFPHMQWHIPYPLKPKLFID